MRAAIGRAILWFIWKAEEPKRRAVQVEQIAEDARRAASKAELNDLCEKVFGFRPEDQE